MEMLHGGFFCHEASLNTLPVLPNGYFQNDGHKTRFSGIFFDIQTSGSRYRTILSAEKVLTKLMKKCNLYLIIIKLDNKQLIF